jgi:Flp pilus assembly protein TadG
MNGNSITRLKKWLLGQEAPEARRAARKTQPTLVVHYWDGSAPEGRGLRDISYSGAYVYTPERWYPGTIIRIVLQGCRASSGPGGRAGSTVSTCVPARVVRHGADGVAVEFAFRNRGEQDDFRSFLAAIENPPPDNKGQALAEFALLVPLVFLLAVNAINFAGFIFAWITVANAARAGAQYMVMSSASPGSPAAATNTQITSLVTSDVTSLPNRSSIVVATCTNATAAANSCTTLYDPEAPNYTLATVDVTYTYKPYIPLFSFPSRGISATLPSTTIHRKAVMRMLQ